MPEITQDNFRILLPGKIAKAVFLAAEHSGEDCFEVAKRFYASPVYHELERESSKYWWLSPEQLESAMELISAPDDFSIQCSSTRGVKPPRSWTNLR